MDNNLDNNFENEFYGYEPQKPLTEKTEIPPQVSEALDTESFQPEKPLVTNQPGENSEEQPFNPICHTAVYADNRFVDGQTEDDAPAAPDYYAQQPPQQPPQQPFYPQPPFPQPEEAPQQEPPKGKNKVNTALIVVIVVLGVMLTASLCGIVGYSMLQSKSSSSSPSKSDNGGSQLIPDFTLPDDRGFSIPDITEEPSPEHKESDFSDKADKDFAGLELAEKPADAKTNAAYNAESAFKAVSDSVVSVLCFTGETGDNTKADSQGSGIIITADGYVITNSHVVGNSKTAYAIKVVTSDNKEYTAGVVGFDSRTDLAVLKLVDAEGLKPAVFGDSDKIELGEDLIVIGNPGGIEYKNSMTKGIVSAINRDISGKNMVKYIQTDAAINPGNSGGPAVNICGQVVGVASAKIADEKYEGMGFCIPSNQVKQIADTLIRSSYVEGRVKIGISGNAVTAAEQEAYQVPKGIAVYSIAEGGPCDNTDLKKNDIITAFDGESISSFAEIYQALEEHKPGDKVKLSFYRPDDGKTYEIEIVLQEDK